MNATTLSLGLVVAFSNVNPGERLPQASLVDLNGATRSYLGATEVSVFFFFTPGSRYGELALRHLATLEQELEGKPITWVGLVSGSVAPEEARASATKAGLRAPVLRDEGDQLYGALGTALTPVVGVADRQHRLLAYLPFAKLGYADAIRAWIRRGLGEISEEQLRAVLAPPPAPIDGGQVESARRYIRLAARHLETGDLDRAHSAARKAVDLAPELAAAHAELAQVLVRRGNCEELEVEIQRTKALDGGALLRPADELACPGGNPQTSGTGPPSTSSAGAPADAGQPVRTTDAGPLPSAPGRGDGGAR